MQQKRNFDSLSGEEIFVNKSNFQLYELKAICSWEVDVALLVERSLSRPEVRGPTPVIGKIYVEHLFVYLFIINRIEKTKKHKKAWNSPLFLKKSICSLLVWHDDGDGLNENKV